MSTNFLTTLSVQETVAILEQFTMLEAEDCSLDVAEYRVLAKPVYAAEDLPPANRSGMDGFAINAKDSFGASENNPVWLPLVGDITIDTPPQFSLELGTCASIVTGGHLPDGADAIMMVEYTALLNDTMIEMRRTIAPGAYVMHQGEDVQAGNIALPQGTFLRPQELGLLAALGITQVSVYRKPRVSILSTGDELVPIETTPRQGQIRDVNATSLAALVRRAGASPAMLGIAKDTLQDLTEHLEKALQGEGHDKQTPDLILLSGGSSVGLRDLTLTALASFHNAEIVCHGVAISPGKPLILARIQKKQAVTGETGQTLIMGLPGQIASAQVVMHILGQPFLRHIAGTPNAFDQKLWPCQYAQLAHNQASQQGREEYVRVRLVHENGGLVAYPETGLSGLMRSLLRADGLMRIPAHVEGFEAKTMVPILLFRYL